MRLFSGRVAAVGIFCVSLLVCLPLVMAQQHGNHPADENLSTGTPATVHGRDGITLPPPPVAAVKPVTDDYFGTKVVDDYRWLENANSPETKAWIAKQNAYTQKELDQVKITPQIQRELTALERVDRYSTPTLRAGKYFFEKRLANEN
jgi:hypothetical protein